MRLSRNRLLGGFAPAYVNLFRSITLAIVVLQFFLIVPAALRVVLGGKMPDIRLASAFVAFAPFEAA